MAPMPRSDWYRSEGVQARASDAVTLYSTRSKCASLFRLLRQSKASILNIHYGMTRIPNQATALARLAGFRRVVCSQHHPMLWNPKRPDWRWRTWLGCRLASEVVVTTPYLENHIRIGAKNASNIQVIPLGVPFHPATESRQATRQKWNIPERALVISCLCRFWWCKGFRELVDAVNHARRHTDLDVRLVLAGDGPELPANPRLRNRTVGRPGRPARPRSCPQQCL